MGPPPTPSAYVQHPHLSSGLGLCSLHELCCRCTHLQPCLWPYLLDWLKAVGSLSPGKISCMYTEACSQSCLWPCLLGGLRTHAVALSPALSFKLLDGASSLHLAWDCQQTLLLAPSSACHAQTLWDCAPSVRALPALGPPSPLGLPQLLALTGPWQEAGA